jgi:tetratricopeptide (TPR) repeat protein
MPRTIPPPLSLALTFLRLAQGWSQKELAAVTGIPATLLSDYEHGRKRLSRDRLEPIAAATGLPPAAIDTVLGCLQTIRASSQVPGPAGVQGWKIEAVATRVGGLATDFARGLLTLLTVEARALEARQQAAALWTRLKRQPPAQRRSVVEARPEFRNWALCELLCEESIKAAPDSADRALELAELALRVAKLSPGEESWRQRLQGYAWAHVGNARRVRGDLPAAEKAFTCSRRAWCAGETSDHGILNEARVLGMEASLLRVQRRFSEALVLLDRALAIAATPEAKYLLLNQATLYEQLADFEAATAALRRAAPLVEEDGDPRLLLGLSFNLAANLCLAGRHREAEVLVPEIRRLAAGLNTELDLVRLRWLEGRIAAGLANTRGAIDILSRVREELSARELAFDAAQVSLELSVLYLEEGRTAEVKMLVHQMAPIFRARSIHAEALVALKLFRDAVEREAITIDLARRLVAYFQRAQKDPGLRLEDL